MAKRTMAKRAKTAAKNRKNAPALVKAAQGVSLPAVAKAARAIPVPVILLAVGACAVGALALFLFDATEGQRRRQLIRDKALHAGETISKGGRQLRERVESVATEATKLVRGVRPNGMANGRTDERMGEQAMHA